MTLTVYLRNRISNSLGKRKGVSAQIRIDRVACGRLAVITCDSCVFVLLLLWHVEMNVLRFRRHLMVLFSFRKR